MTGEKGQTQMLFVDQSALTIGPNSDLVLDEFVYDPNTETGTIVMSATKGLFSRYPLAPGPPLGGGLIP